MLSPVVFPLLCSWTIVTLRVHGQRLTLAHNPAEPGDFLSTSPASSVLRRSPCFVDDIVVALREAEVDGSDLTNSTLSMFGVCFHSETSSHLVLFELVEVTRNTEDFRVLHPTAALVPEEDGWVIKITFDLPQSTLLKLNPVLLLAFESPPKSGELNVIFSGQCLQNQTQLVCISEATQYILLPVLLSDNSMEQKLRIFVKTNSLTEGQNLKDILIGGKSGRDIRVTPLLLLSGKTGTNTRHSEVSAQTSFICELRRFFSDVLPHDHSNSQPLQLDSLQSSPPLTIGLSSSETLMARAIKSSAPVIFSFSGWSVTPPAHPGQLALSSELLELLSQRLVQSEMQIQDLIDEEKVARRAKERLARLKLLSAFQQTEHVAGESQYCAFLLLKALQTVAHAYATQRKLRAPRAGPENPSSDPVCALRVLTVSFEKHLLGPQSANINNCQGSCAFPLTNPNNHAVLLNSHIESATEEVRSPCCVPVVYEPMEVIDFNSEGSFITLKPNMIAKECGCR